MAFLTVYDLLEIYPMPDYCDLHRTWQRRLQRWREDGKIRAGQWAKRGRRFAYSEPVIISLVAQGVKSEDEFCVTLFTIHREKLKARANSVNSVKSVL